MKIIAEIGLNHCGSIKRGMKLVVDLINTSVDAITFQVREKEFYDQTHPRKDELPLSFYKEAIEIIHKENKLAGITIAQVEKVEIFNEMRIDFWKTLSWDLNNIDLQNKLQKTNKNVFVSTGVSSMEEILEVSKKLNYIEFIHTQLNYSLEDVNIKAIQTIRELTKKPVAFGLHSKEHKVLYTTLGFEPSALFFYVKDNTDGEHPDDEHAISIIDVEYYCLGLKEISLSIGTGKKQALRNALHPEDDNVSA